MESLTDKIARFLERGYGSGSGSGRSSGSGSGRGSGSGSGYGFGSGDGFDDGSGSGSGRGSGFGSGYGSGSGYGYYGDGSGFGSGYGFGSGDGSGSGSGISKINGMDVNEIDDVPTIITSVHGGLAKGAILRGDLQLIPCFIAKVDDHFAHGETAREAVETARAKAFEDMPQEARIEAFLQEIEPNKAYPTMTFYVWHHRLTGSCEMGRKAFAKDHNVDLDGKMTREEFFALTKDAYGASIIREAMRAAKEAEA